MGVAGEKKCSPPAPADQAEQPSSRADHRAPSSRLPSGRAKAASKTRNAPSVAVPVPGARRLGGSMPKQMHPAHDGTPGTPILRTLQSFKLELAGFCLYRHRLQSLRCCLAGKCTAGGAGPRLEAPRCTPPLHCRAQGGQEQPQQQQKPNWERNRGKNPHRLLGTYKEMPTSILLTWHLLTWHLLGCHKTDKSFHVRLDTCQGGVSKLGHRQHPRPGHWVEETVLGRSRGCSLRQNGSPVVCAQQGCGDTRCPLHSSVTCILCMKHLPIQCEKGGIS